MNYIGDCIKNTFSNILCRDSCSSIKEEKREITHRFLLIDNDNNAFIGPSNMPVLTRRGLIGDCNCKVGACRKCGSTCKRCKCSCDGVSPINAMKRYHGAKKANHRRTRRPKRKKQTSSLIEKDITEKKRRLLNQREDDSLFTVSLSKNDESTTTKKDVAMNVADDKDGSSKLATIFVDKKEELWKHHDVPFETILELQKLLKSIQKTKAINMLLGFIDKVVFDHNCNDTTSTDDFLKIGDIMKECMLPSSTVEELTVILFGVNRLKNNTGVQTRSQKSGKNLVTLTELKRRI